MAGSGSSAGQQNVEDVTEDSNGLLLYHFQPSYYSQRVVFALHEKKLPFKSEEVNLVDGAHFEPFFMKLNPKAEVPVLKDGVKVIPDSTRIIDYLEDNFSNGDTPRLKPEKSSASYQSMESFVSLIEKIPIKVITFGCFFDHDLAERTCMTQQEIKARTDRYVAHLVILCEFIEKYPEFAEQYKLKKDVLEKNYKAAQNSEEVKKALDVLEEVLNTIEKELESHKGDKEKWWLCGEKFTIADIYLAVLLQRLHYLGLSDYYDPCVRPNLATYFKRIQLRDAFMKTVYPSTGILGSLCSLGKKEKLALSLGSAMVVLGVVGLAAFLIQRKK